MTLSDLRSARRTIVLATLSLAPVALAAPDSIWIADVVTVDDARPRAEAVAVEDGRITPSAPSTKCSRSPMRARASSPGWRDCARLR